jgi:Ni,Fe-hydrogenase III small subunit/Pyruvate/2-oxoacid:ferredoxin oxidoreductase delta subunit
MLRELVERFRQGYRTMPYPQAEPPLPDRFRGRPVCARVECDAGCRACAEVCPTGALSRGEAGPAIDMGRCLFCAECAAACPRQALQFSREHRLSAWAREDLVVREPRPAATGRRDDSRLRLFRRSLKLRQVSAGGCSACEADINVLGTPAFDLGRFGIQIVASPRHADGLVVTGPVTDNMKLALEKTYRAVPPPRLVIAVGACAIAGGPYRGHAETHDGVADLLPVDLFIPGCPPHPLTLLDGLLQGRLCAMLCLLIAARSRRFIAWGLLRRWSLTARTANSSPPSRPMMSEARKTFCRTAAVS